MVYVKLRHSPVASGQDSNRLHKDRGNKKLDLIITLSGARSPAIIFKIVDLPVPEGPIIPTASPCLICISGNLSSHR
jgi:hypothetical protein